MMMKKLLSLFLATSMVVSLFACAAPQQIAQAEENEDKILKEEIIEPIYYTKEEYKASYKIPEYKENSEITGEYSEKLAAKCVNGTFVGQLEENDIKVWRGIPFGKIPARFERSINPDASDKVYEAYYFGKSCMQVPDDEEMASKYEQGEDCLTLAVYTKDNDIKNKPVLVYIHGGGWACGGTCDPLYNGKYFAYYNPDMVLVNITYRVGVLGQINLGAKIRRDEDGKEAEYLLDDYGENIDKFKTSTNNGLLDQVQALRWIKENITAFGGDANNITIAGESAGGCSVSSLVMMACDDTIPYISTKEGLFNKAISLSGGINQSIGLETSEALTNAIVKSFGVNTIKELQDIPYEKLKEWWGKPENNQYINYSTLDGVVLPIDAYESYKKNVGNQITVLQGATTNEFAYYRRVLKSRLDDLGKDFKSVCKAVHDMCIMPTIAKPDLVVSNEFKEAYNSYMNALDELGYKTEQDKLFEFANDYYLQGINYYMADKQVENGGKTYIYAFDQSFDGRFKELGAAHGVDCYYLFGAFNGDDGEGRKEEVDFSIKFMKMISNFCKTGSPSIEGLKWRPYDKESKSCMFMNDKEIKLIDSYQSDRISNMVKMFDTSQIFSHIAPWSDVFKVISNDTAYN